MPERSSPGQATVEVALLLPVVCLLLLAVVQVGLVVRDQVLVTHAAREAARAAAVDPTEAAARDGAVGAAGLDPARLVVDLTEADGRVTATVTYRAPTEVPLVGALLGDRSLQASVTMALEV